MLPKCEQEVKQSSNYCAEKKYQKLMLYKMANTNNVGIFTQYGCLGVFYIQYKEN